MTHRSSRSLSALAVVALVLAGCGTGSPDVTATATMLPDGQGTVTEAPSPSPSPSPTPAPASPAPTPTPTPSPTVPSGDLPGTPVAFGPAAGEVLAVVGVAHDDVLNLRVGPGTDQEVVAGLAPTEDQVVATGAARQREATWYEVEVGETSGWASAAFLAWPGQVDDVTSSVREELGDTPSASSMEALGELVAGVVATDEPSSRVRTVVAGDESGDLGEVTHDVIGLGDDAILGVRLHVLGTPTGDGFELAGVEQTLLCARGVDDDGACT